MKTRYILMVCAAAAVALSSCDKFLDEMPDNRAEVNSVEKVAALLGDAYCRTDYMMVTELLADNMDNNEAVVASYADRFFEQVWNWQDVTESNNESPENIWQNNWGSIAAANQALEAIGNMGGKENPELSGSYGEALLARAYAHFILVNIFCMHYNSKTSATDLGIPYMDQPEQGLMPQYERSNVAEVYKRIDEDIQEGLKYVTDNYAVPKYHFNTQAAYAFAARFYLYYEKPDKALEYANRCLGPVPALRDYDELNTYPSKATASAAYVRSDMKSNLLLQTGASNQGLFWGANAGSYKHYGHTTNLALTETIFGRVPWLGEEESFGATRYRFQPKNYSVSRLRFTIFWNVPYEFEVTNPVAGTGYRRTLYPAFTTDACLLDRAEAKILLRDFQGACDDLNLWSTNMYTSPVNVTPEQVTEFYGKMPYYTWQEPTPKKHLEPVFDIDEEGSTQESMLQYVLHSRRVETLGFGIRWFDVKRYGITIFRRVSDGDGAISSISDELKPGDPRRAVQIPLRVRDAGFQANPR